MRKRELSVGQEHASPSRSRTLLLVSHLLVSITVTIAWQWAQPLLAYIAVIRVPVTDIVDQGQAITLRLTPAGFDPSAVAVHRGATYVRIQNEAGMGDARMVIRQAGKSDGTLRPAGDWFFSNEFNFQPGCAEIVSETHAEIVCYIAVAP